MEASLDPQSVRPRNGDHLLAASALSKLKIRVPLDDRLRSPNALRLPQKKGRHCVSEDSDAVAHDPKLKS